MVDKYNWQGGAGNFSDASKWGGKVPGQVETGYVASGVVTVGGASDPNNNYIQSGSLVISGTGVLTIESGASLTLTASNAGNLYVPQFVATGIGAFVYGTLELGRELNYAAGKVSVAPGGNFVWNGLSGDNINGAIRGADNLIVDLLGGTLSLRQGFDGQIDNFDGTDVIQVAGGDVTKLSYSTSNKVLTVDTTFGFHYNLHFIDDYQPFQFTFSGNQITYTIQAVPLAPKITGLAANTDTGISQSDGVTKSGTINVTGTGEVNDTVSLFVDGKLLPDEAPGKTVIVDSNGLWSRSFAISEGTHAITATQTLYNTSNLSTAYTVRVDFHAPSINSITLDKAAYKLGDTVTATFNVSAADGNGSYVLKSGTTINGAALTQTGYSNSSTNNTITATFVVGPDTTEVIAGNVATNAVIVDTAGNESPYYATAIGSKTIDTHAPTDVRIAGFTNGPTDTGTSLLKAGTTIGALTTTDASPGETFSYSLTGTDKSRFTVVNGALAVGSTDLTAAAVYKFNIVSSDLGGNSFSQAVQVTALQPSDAVTAVSASSASGNLIRATQTVDVAVTTATPVTVTGQPQLQLNNGGVAVYASTDANGVLHFTYTVTANQDISNLKITGYAANGGVVTPTNGSLFDPSGIATLAGADTGIAVDTTAPTLTSGSDKGALKGGETAKITFTFSEDPGTSFVWDGSTGDIDVSGGTLGAISGSGLIRTATFTPNPDVNNGTASITVLAGTYTDKAGNPGSTGASQPISFDTKAPSQPDPPILDAASDTGFSNSDRITNITVPTITGTAEANAAVTLYDGSVVVGTGKANGSGAYSIAASALSEATHSLTVKATDSAGNVSVASAALSVIVDTTAPKVLSIAPVGGAAITNNASSDDFTVTFSEDVTGVDKDDFVQAGDAKGTVASVTPISNSVYKVTVNAITADGSLTLNLKNSGTGIADIAGNPETAGFVGTAAYVVDRTAPVISGVTLDRSSYKLGDTVTATIQLSGAYDGHGDYTLGANSTLDGQTLTAGSYTSGSNKLTASFIATGANLAQLSNDIVAATIFVADAVGNVSVASTTGIPGVTIDTLAPLISTATVNGNILTLTFTETGSGLSSTDPALPVAFTVKDGASPIVVNAVAYDAAAKTMTLTLASAVANGDTVTLNYSAKATPAKEIQDVAGNLTLDFASPVTNTTPAPPPPAPSVTNAAQISKGATFVERIAGTASGQFDQLKVTGTVALGDVTLSVSEINCYVSSRFDRFVIIDNDGTDAVQGTFAGLSEGSVVGVGARSLRISYHGGDGNDVTLTDTTGLIFNPLAYGALVTTADSPAGSIYGLYEALLNRAPDPLGLMSFTTALEIGATLAQIATTILASSEHGGTSPDPAAFVRSLYTNLLGRPADSGGFNFYAGELASGVSQATVAAQIATSAEAKTVLAPIFATGVVVIDASEASVARLYEGLLGRPPDAAGLLAWSAAIETGVGGAAGEAARLQQVAAAIIGSPEYAQQHGTQTDAAFVADLYRNALGRTPDTTGAASYAYELSHGVSRAQVALEITQSVEAQVHLMGLIQDGTLLAA